MSGAHRGKAAALAGAFLMAMTLGMEWSPTGATGRAFPSRLLVVAAAVAAVVAVTRPRHRATLLAAAAGSMTFAVLWSAAQIRLITSFSGDLGRHLAEPVLLAAAVAVALVLYARHAFGRPG